MGLAAVIIYCPSLIIKDQYERFPRWPFTAHRHVRSSSGCVVQLCTDAVMISAAVSLVDWGAAMSGNGKDRRRHRLMLGQRRYERPRISGRIAGAVYVVENLVDSRVDGAQDRTHAERAS